MPPKTLAEFRTALAHRDRELDLVMAIDRIRDTATNPDVMLYDLVNLLADTMNADLCLLGLINRETEQLEIKAVNGYPQQLSALAKLLQTECLPRLTSLRYLTFQTTAELSLPDDLQTAYPNLQVAIVPILLSGGRYVGTILLSRAQQPFTDNDAILLTTAEALIDSAVIQREQHFALAQQTKELETIYRIDHIRDKNLPFSEMLNAVLDIVCRTIDAEMGFVMLYNQQGQVLELRAATHQSLTEVTAYYETIADIAQRSLHEGKLVYTNALTAPLNAVMALPLILQDRIIGVLGVTAPQLSNHFDYQHRRLLNAIGSQIDTAIFEKIELRRLKKVLGRSVDPQIMTRLLENPDVDFLKGERALVTVLYADIRGSTKLAEETKPELLVGFINDYLGTMTQVILEHQGTLDKFVGDEVMALFGAPFAQPDQAVRAVRTAMAMQAAHQNLMVGWQQKGINARPIGIGIATGELIVGEMGSAQRSDYTVIGRAANLGARICGAATAGQILISPDTYALAADQLTVNPIAGQSFKGIGADITVYEVVGLQKMKSKR